MPTLSECMKDIRELVRQKGHEDDLSDATIFGKGLFAIIELGEALDIIKKKGVRYLKPEELYQVSEELIDTIFYVLDIYGMLYRDLEVEDPDTVFNMKMLNNLERTYKYGRPK